MSHLNDPVNQHIKTLLANVPQKRVTSVADVTIYLTYVFTNYTELQNFYDARYNRWNFYNYRGKQKALNEVMRYSNDRLFELLLGALKSTMKIFQERTR